MSERPVVTLPNAPTTFSWIPVGWAGIVSAALNHLDEMLPGYRLDQINEKYGGLRIRVTPPPGTSDVAWRRAQARIGAAEVQSTWTCALCGRPDGQMVEDGECLRVRCDEHVDVEHEPGAGVRVRGEG